MVLTWDRPQSTAEVAARRAGIRLVRETCRAPFTDSRMRRNDERTVRRRPITNGGTDESAAGHKGKGVDRGMKGMY